MNGYARCDVCGRSSEVVPLQMTWRENELTVYCPLCEGLVKAGLLRPETVDGRVRYRRWMPEWKPGELLPESVWGRPLEEAS